MRKGLVLRATKSYFESQDSWPIMVDCTLPSANLIKRLVRLATCSVISKKGMGIRTSLVQHGRPAFGCNEQSKLGRARAQGFFMIKTVMD